MRPVWGARAGDPGSTGRGRGSVVCAGKFKAAPDEMISMFRREDIHMVVVGDETNGYWRIMGCNYQKTVSVDEWR